MHVIFIEPSFPANQARFVHGLHAAGVRVVGIGERPKDALETALRARMVHYEHVPSVVDEGALAAAVRRVQGWVHVDRLEATVEAHVLPAAHVREACGIPGTTSRTAYLCRDKPAMKEVLRGLGIPCARSTGGGDAEALRAFAREVGYPLVVKPRSAAGAAGTGVVKDEGELNRALAASGVGRGAEVALEEFLEGHEGFYDTLSVEGRVVHDFVTHYYPNVLEAMRTRWISPQFVTTNRIDTAPDYAEVRELGRRANEGVGIWTSATHMEWFFGPEGLRFSEIGCRPPGVGAWDLYAAANEMDLYREWAHAVCFGHVRERPSRRYSAGIIALRPDRDGVIDRYEGVDELQRAFGEWVLDAHLPPPGTPTQPVEAGFMANAWVRMRHPDYDELRRMLDRVGETLEVRAR